MSAPAVIVNDMTPPTDAPDTLTEMLRADSDLARRYTDFLASAQDRLASRGCVRSTSPLPDHVVFDLELLVAAVDRYQQLTGGTRPAGTRAFLTRRQA